MWFFKRRWPHARGASAIHIIIGPYSDAPATYNDYDPGAPAIAARLADAITAIAEGLSVEHIGSTAVPGCAGKGIVDLMVLYPPGHLPRAKQALDQFGFQRQSTRDPFPEDRPMRVGAVVYGGKQFRIHAHVLAADAAEAATLRAFRDRLRADAEYRAAYEACKRRILAAGVTDSVAYAEAKGEFIHQR
jgi:GrpB-like predicted nucleotidyltransferase (UPF0157 family)